MIVITEQANEQSTFVFTVGFTDENGTAVTPDSIQWSLTDRSGTVINLREDVAVDTPAAEISIVLSGDDLQILEAETGQRLVPRRLVVEATYTNTLGAGLPVKEVAAFAVRNFPYVE